MCKIAKILMINLPYAGHTNPTLVLAKELVKRGHLVDYINAPEWEEKIANTGATFIPYLNYKKGLTEQQKKTQCVSSAYQTALAQNKKYDILIYEMLFSLGKKLADKLEIPCVRQFSQPAWSHGTVKYLEKTNRLFRLSAWLITKQMLPNSKAKKLGFPKAALLDSVLNDKANVNVVYLPKELQPYYETFPANYIFASTTINEPNTIKEALSFQSMKKPIIYISMGTIMSSKRFCLACSRAFGNKDMTVILSTGKVAPEKLGTLPPNIYAYSFVPQLDVLKNTDLFITHGGMNSVCEAIHYGVPMLVLPVLNDQPINASQLEKLEIGKRMNIFRATPNALYQNAVSILKDKKMQKKMSLVQENVSTNSSIDDVIEQIETLI